MILECTSHSVMYILTFLHFWFFPFALLAEDFLKIVCMVEGEREILHIIKYIYLFNQNDLFYRNV